MKHLIKGDIIRNNDNDWLLLDVTEGAYLFMMLNTNRMEFKILNASDVDIDIDTNTTEIVAHKDIIENDAFISTPKGAEVDNRNVIIANALLSYDDNLFWLANRNRRASFINKIAETDGRTKKTIRLFLRKYLQNNLTMKGIEARFYRCGGRGKERTYVIGKKPGNPGYPGASKVSLTPETKKALEFGRRRFLKLGCRRSISKIYDDVILEFYSVTPAVNGEHLPIPVSRIDRPTKRQLYYFINKNTNEYERYVARNGERDAWNNKRALLSDTISNLPVRSIGSRYEMDAMDTDFVIVDRYDRNKVLGTPTLYEIKDVFSRIICGYSVGLDTNAWAGAEMALLNMVEDKVEHCAKFGIKINPEDWPVCNVLPTRIQLDNGADFTSFDMERWAVETGTILDFAPTRMASFKPNIERTFGQFNSPLEGIVPGERIKDDYRQSHLAGARLTIDEFEEIVLQFITHYNKTPLDNYPSDEALFSNNIVPAPNKIWNFKLAEGETGLRTIRDMEAYKMSLLSRDTARLTREGIEYKKMLYICEDITWLTSIIQQADFKTRKHNIKYDKRNMNEIYVDFEGEYIKFRINEDKTRNRIYNNCSFEELNSINAEINRRKRENEEQRLTENIQMKYQIDEVVERAQKKHSGTNEVKSRRSNRRKEKEQLHKEKGVLYEAKETQIVTTRKPRKIKKTPTEVILNQIDPKTLTPLELKKYMDQIELEKHINKYRD